MQGGKLKTGKEIVLDLLKINLGLASNPRKLYVEYVKSLGYEFSEDFFINIPRGVLSYPTIDRSLELVINDLIGCPQKYGISANGLIYLQKLRGEGKQKEEAVKQEIVGGTKESLASLLRADKELKAQQTSMFSGAIN